MLCAGREPRIWTTITSLTTLSLSLSLSRRWSRRPVDRRRLFSQPPFGRFHTHTQKKLPPFFFTKKKDPATVNKRGSYRIESFVWRCAEFIFLVALCCAQPGRAVFLSVSLFSLCFFLGKKKVRVFVFFSVWQRCFVFFCVFG